MARLGPGDHFGEMSVVAATPVVVAYVSRHHFGTLLATNPSIRAAVERSLRQRAVVSEERSGEQ